MKYIARFILKLWGWKCIGGVVPEPKAIILGVPHTSNWDFVVSWLYYRSVGGKAYTMIKKEFFFWPACYILRGMGGIPVDRSKGASLIKQMVDEFDRRKVLHLAIAPEGTRKPVAKWKGGFHTIARAVNVPVYYGFFDWGRKEIGYSDRVLITDDLNADLKRIRQWYKDKGIVGRHPEMFNLGNDLD